MLPNGNLLIYVMGCPGSGKGTLCKRLAEKYGCDHISVGDVLRSMAKEPEKLQAIGLPHILGDINGGKLIPTSAIIKILKQAIGIAPAEESPELQFAMEVDAPPKASSQVARRVVLVDGFPRKLDQAEAAGDELRDPDIVLSFRCPAQVAIARYVNRAREATDNTHKFGQRYLEYGKEILPLEKYFNDAGVLVRVKTDGETNESYARLVSALDENDKWVEWKEKKSSN